MAKYDIYISEPGRYDIFLGSREAHDILIYVLTLRVRLSIDGKLGINSKLKKTAVTKKISAKEDIGLTSALLKVRKYIKNSIDNAALINSTIQLHKIIHGNVEPHIGVKSELFRCLCWVYFQAKSQTGISSSEVGSVKYIKVAAKNTVGIDSDVDYLATKKFEGTVISGIQSSLRGIYKKVYVDGFGAITMGMNASDVETYMRRKRLFDEAGEFVIAKNSNATLPELFYITI